MVKTICKFIPFIVALLFSFISNGKNNTKLGGHVYGVAYMDAYYYYISEIVDGEMLGADYACWYIEYTNCTIYSNYPPDLLNRIPRYASIVLDYESQFEDLNPAR